MKFKSILLYLLLGFILSGCVAAGISSVGLLGKSVSVALDPRTVGTQVDDEIMQKNIWIEQLLIWKKIIITVQNQMKY